MYFPNGGDENEELDAFIDRVIALIKRGFKSCQAALKSILNL